MAAAPTALDLLAAVLDRADAARSGGRREGTEVVPLGPKATKTRQHLLITGYDQMVRRGYLATSVEHIHEAAGVSLGTYYQYFRDKVDLMRTLVGEAILDTASTMFQPLDLSDPEGGIRRVIESFVHGYASTAEFQRVWEQATHVDEGLATLRRDVSRLLDGALSDAIVEAQRAGIADPALDPGPTSRALAAMVDRYCYLTFVVETDQPRTPEETVETLVRLWTNALGVRAASGARKVRSGRRSK